MLPDAIVKLLQDYCQEVKARSITIEILNIVGEPHPRTTVKEFYDYDVN